MITTDPVNTQGRPVRSAAVCLLIGASMHIASGAAPTTSVPPAASGVAKPAQAFDDARCDRTLPSGGAAPPTIASAALQAKVKDILAHHGGSSLTPAAAVEIRAAFCKAGLWSHPELDLALAASGLSVKRLEALAPPSPGKATQPASPGSTAGRRIPPRE